MAIGSLGPSPISHHVLPRCAQDRAVALGYILAPPPLHWSRLCVGGPPWYASLFIRDTGKGALG